MPYYRKRNYKKKTFRPRRYKKKYNLTRQLNRLGLALEKKFHSFAQSIVTVPFTGVINSISSVPQGDGASSRDGNKIRVKSIYGKFAYSTINANTNMRMLIIQDNSPDGTPPTFGEVLDDPSPPNAITSALNIANTARFKVILDKRFYVTQTAGQRPIYNMQFYRKCNIPIAFQGSGADSESNSELFLMQISDAAIDGPLVTSYLRLRFYG